MRDHALTAFVLAACLLGSLGRAAGQTPAAPPAPAAPAAPAPVGGERFDLDTRGARSTQQQLWRILREYPPAVGEILQRDPSLLARPDYLAPYPLIAEFLRQHPEVPRNPSFFFGDYNYQERDPRTRSLEVMEDVLVGGALLTGFSIFMGTLAWFVRTLVDHRRWLRQSKVQVDVHTKLLDRLTTNDDLLAYAQTPAGSRFLESAPIALDAEARSSAPLSRILWSLQAGVVLAALGIGLWFVNAGLVEEMGQVLNVFSAIAIALGLGFVASAAAAYVVSGRLGLLPARRQ